MDNISHELSLYVAAFLVVAFVAIWFMLKDRDAAGLKILFIIDLAVNHFFGALIYCFSWYEPTSKYIIHMNYGSEQVLYSFRMVLVGMLAFVSGNALSLIWSRTDSNKYKFRIAQPGQSEADGPNPQKIFWYSLGAYLVFVPLVRGIPSINQLAEVFWKLMICGVLTTAVNRLRSGKRRQFYVWCLGGILLFPGYTLLQNGFLSFGIAAALPLAILLLRQTKSRLAAISMLLIGVYLGLSLFVNYLSNRTEYRQIAWEGQGGFSEKVENLRKMATNFQLLDIKNNRHLEAIDMRLNQNSLTGMGVERMTQGLVDRLNGQTLWLSLTALVPRAIWPGKPEYGGSGDWIAILTGQKISEGTSFGVGTVLEFYANAGVPGIIVGFLFLGLVIGYCDRKAASYMNTLRPSWDFYLWFGGGFALVNNLGILAETIGACWIFMATILIIKSFGRNRKGMAARR